MAEKIAVIGAGLIGRSRAIVFARAGHQVALYDVADGAVDSALDLIDAALPDLAAVDAGADTVNVFWNQGDGRFSEPSLFGVGDKPNDLVVAALHSDGDVDLADVLSFQAAFTGAR